MKSYNIFFSPTGGTKKVAEIVAKGTNPESEEIDLIKEPDKLTKVKFEKEDLCLVSVPSYGGRVPSVVVDMFRNVKADGTKVILAVVFGNRAIDDTLLELQTIPRIRWCSVQACGKRKMHFLRSVRKRMPDGGHSFGQSEIDR